MSNVQIPGKVVGKGCVGECGSTATVEYNVAAPTHINMLVKTVESSLCGNTGALAFIFRNGEEVAHGRLTGPGAMLQAEAAPGDQIVVFALTYPIPNEIVCVRQGNLDFEVIQMDFV